MILFFHQNLLYSDWKESHFKWTWANASSFTVYVRQEVFLSGKIHYALCIAGSYKKAILSPCFLILPVQLTLFELEYSQKQPFAFVGY